LTYFFLTGFLVAFFFIALFSLGLDLGPDIPGFFFATIRIPPLGSLLPDERQNLRFILLAQIIRIIRISSVRIKRFAD